MAELIKTLRASGGDYTSIQTWWDTECVGYDCVANSTSPVLEGYDDWPGGLTEVPSLTGSVTSNTTYRPIIRAAAGNECGGILGQGFGITGNTSYGSLLDTHTTSNITLENFWFQNTGSNSAQGLYGQSNLRAVGLVGKAANGTAFNNIATGDIVRACLAIGSSAGFQNYNWNNGTIINCVAVNCGSGFHSAANGSYTVKNSVAYGCTNSFYGSKYSAGCTRNAASDGATVAPPGSNPYASDVVAGDFVDAANNDFHLSASSGLIGAGANLYTDGSDVDIDGEAWPNSVWDIGFDYYVAAGGGTTSVTADLTLQWNVLQQITTDNDTRWAILTAVESDLQTAWNLLNHVTRDEFTSWDILQQLTRDVNISWDVLAALYHITTDVDLLFNIINAVQRDMQTAWSVLNQVTRDQATAWNLLHALTQDVQTGWHVLESVERDVDLRWNVASNLTAITTDLNLRWNLMQAIVRSFDTEWHLLEAITQDADIRWHIANAVSTELNTRWDIRNQVVTDFNLRWNSLEAMQSSLTVHWSVDGLAITPISMITIRPEIREIPVPFENRIIPVRRTSPW